MYEVAWLAEEDEEVTGEPSAPRSPLRGGRVTACETGDY